MKKSAADKKDQTYFLYGIPKEILPKLIFPLEEFTSKEAIRKIAEENELAVAKKADSQEVCFIPDNNYVRYVEETVNQKTENGNIVLLDGTVLGRHNGLINYTIGQRKGLGIAYKEPLYVIKLNKEKNEVIVGREADLYSNILQAEELNFLLDMDLSKPVDIKAKVRYRATAAEAILYPQKNGKVKVEFKQPQRAITPGQSVVFYIDDIVLGGGKIVDNIEK